jgi:hypothetical protein
MLLYVVLSLSVAFASAMPANVDPLSQEAIDHINSLDGMTWKAGKNFADSYTIDDIKAMCGALKSPHPFLKRKIFSMKLHYEALACGLFRSCQSCNPCMHAVRLLVSFCSLLITCTLT